MTIKYFTNYILNNYNNEVLESYFDQKGTRKNRIKNHNKLQELKENAKNIFKVDKLNTDFKPGPAYNCSNKPWIHIYNEYNKKGTKGEYLGISFDNINQTLEIWFGFGFTHMSKNDVIINRQKYQAQLKTIEPNLKRNFKYESLFVEATVISKSIPINEIDDNEIKEDLNYLANIYNIYEQQFRLNTTPNSNNNYIENPTNITEPSKKIEGINILYKGFPGTGKSYTVKLKYLSQKDQHNKLIYDENNNHKLIDPYQYEVITFYPEYTNANFIGSILPTTENNIITYKFVPGPFTKLLKRSINNPQTNFYLIIEDK